MADSWLRWSSFLGVLAYRATRDEALARAKALGLRVIADRLEDAERASELNNLFTAA